MMVNNRMIKMKAQMSLEMIIGLLILVIVAAVVIRTFLTSMTTIQDLESFKKTTEFKEFETKCQNYCRDYSTTGNPGYAVMFCTTRLLPEGTKNKLGNPAQVDALDATKGGLPLFRGWEVCEDAIFCFHLFDCSDYSTITPEDCRRILCEYYKDVFTTRRGETNYTALSDKVKEVFKGKAKAPYGSCNLDTRNNWWTKYFENQFIPDLNIIAVCGPE
mgnify:CR=1 FL=1